MPKRLENRRYGYRILASGKIFYTYAYSPKQAVRFIEYREPEVIVERVEQYVGGRSYRLIPEKYWLAKDELEEYIIGRNG